jgi:hypothetical protein
MPLDRIVISRNADLWRIAPGEVGVRELLLGVIVVGVLAGLVIGRHTERVRRNYKDYGTAKSAVSKYRQTHMDSLKAASGRILVWGAIVVFAIFVFLNLPAARS